MQIKKIVLAGIVIGLFTVQTIGQEVGTLNTAIRKQVIDSTRSALIHNYVYPEKTLAISNYILQKLKNGEYDSIFDCRQLANILTKDIRYVQPDNHLSIRYDPDLENRIRTFVATSQKDTIELEKERKENFFFRKVEILNGNIGYVVFTNFADTSVLSRRTVGAALQFVANADALILDLRKNFGGRPEMAKEITSYFFCRPQLTGRTFNRITNSWTEEWIGNQPEIKQNLTLTMPIYILTSDRTFSAAESLAYNLQHLKNAVVVGDTTRGSAHATRSFALGNGFVGFIPFTRGEHAVTKTDWEGTGVIPNVAINEDSSLLKAQELILKQRLSTIRNITEQRKLEWLLNDLQTRMIKVLVLEEVLKTYTGTFEEFLFTLEDGKLFCQNIHQRNKKDKLVPIRDNLFKIDNESQVKFNRDKNGTVSNIRLLWNDGWVDTIKKN